MEMSGGRSVCKRTAAAFALILTGVFLIVFLPGRGQTIPCRTTVPAPQDKHVKAVFLVADEHITGSIFSETVIFLISYDQNGAMGVIINRPSDVTLSSVFPDIRGLQKRKDSLYVGGPVALDQLMILVRSGGQPEASHRLFDNLYLSYSTTALQRIVDGHGGDERFRVYAGYAGWAPGQLEQEISRNDWHIVEADTAFIFDKAASSVWPELSHIRHGLDVMRERIRSAQALSSLPYPPPHALQPERLFYRKYLV